MKKKYSETNKSVRDKTIWIRVTDYEKESLKKMLEGSKYNVSSYIREMIFKRIDTINK